MAVLSRAVFSGQAASSVSFLQDGDSSADEENQGNFDGEYTQNPHKGGVTLAVF